MSNRSVVADGRRPKLWGANIAEDPPTVTYDSVMPDKAGADAAEKGVLKWLEKVVSLKLEAGLKVSL